MSDTLVSATLASCCPAMYSAGVRAIMGTSLPPRLGVVIKEPLLSGCGSAKRERKSLRTRIKKLDFDLPISDGLRLTDQLIQPLLGSCAIALLINVGSVSRARQLPID